MPDGAVLAVLDGVLERVTFANPETGYTIARIAPERGSGVGAELVTAVGPLLGAQVGEFLRLRGPAGAGNLNLLLQEALTPFADGRPERRYGGRVFRVGDKVTQLRNNYDKGTAGIFNGTVGVVTGLSAEEHTLTVLTDEDESVDYGFDELDELAHAYAVTIHRSQGSEYPAVVIPLTTASWMMLQRNLLYTGVTRAKKLVVLAGSRRALAAAVRTGGARPPPHRPGVPPASRYSPELKRRAGG